MSRTSRRICMWIGRRSAKFGLQPVALARNAGFNPKDLAEIQRIVREEQSTLMEAWHGYFGTERG